MIYYIDIDGTICTHEVSGDYDLAKPYDDRILRFNELYDSGNEVHYWTARGTQSGKDWIDYTKLQLSAWGVKYTTLNVGKPHYDVWIDDKAVNVSSYFNQYSMPTTFLSPTNKT
jgi:hypothetical protein